MNCFDSETGMSTEPACSNSVCQQWGIPSTLIKWAFRASSQQGNFPWRLMNTDKEGKAKGQSKWKPKNLDCFGGLLRWLHWQKCPLNGIFNPPVWYVWVQRSWVRECCKHAYYSQMKKESGRYLEYSPQTETNWYSFQTSMRTYHSVTEHCFSSRLTCQDYSSRVMLEIFLCRCRIFFCVTRGLQPHRSNHQRWNSRHLAFPGVRRQENLSQLQKICLPPLQDHLLWDAWIKHYFFNPIKHCCLLKYILS